MTMIRFNAKHNYQRGFTLLEVLVSLLVLSIGLLGLAGLQTYSLRNNHSAFLRSQAVSLAYDALDRMRGNRDQVLKGTGSAYNTTFAATVSSVNCSSNCSSATMAQYDLAQWKEDVARLPEGRGQISIDSDSKATVAIEWSDSRETQTVSVEALL